MNKMKGHYAVYIISSIFIAISLVLTICFRIIFPGEPAPLRLFSFSWRITRSFIDFIVFFPAIAFSALVIPFGLQSSPGDQFSSFSSRFLEIIKGHIFLAIILSAVYGLLSLLAFPLLLNAQNTMIYEGELYRDSQRNAKEAADERNWDSAARYLAICEKIWENSPELEAVILRDRINSGLISVEMAEAAEHREESDIDPWITLRVPSEWAPLNAEDAISLAEKAFAEENYYDAHWLATIAARFIPDGSAEKRNIELFAAEAWKKIELLEPSSTELRNYSLFHRKLDGYNAMISGDWIRAYYIFQALIAEMPRDTPPDAELQGFFAMAKTGIEQVAFFQDEMHMDMGELQTNAVFSLPLPEKHSAAVGRLIIRMETLSTFADFCYGIGIEMIAFDSAGNLLYRGEAPYGKIIPLNINLDEGSGASGVSGIEQSVLLMNVLDRNDENTRWQPQWSGAESVNSVQMILDLSFEDFLLLSNAKRGVGSLSVHNLFEGIGRLSAYGYIPEIFEAEILNRFMEPLFFLPMAILSIVIGWRFRAIKKPRYIILPMIGVLPVVFNEVTAFYRSIAHTIGTSLILSMSFTGALLVFFAFNFVYFIIVLIILAGQRGNTNG